METNRKETVMRRASMCVSVGFLLAGAAGCGIIDADEFRGGVPTREAVNLQVPGGSTSGALTAEGVTRSALLGEKADTYTTTRAITAVVNGGTWAVLSLVRTVIDFPASSLHGDTAVWGPHTEPLSPNTWKLTVTRLEKNKFHWLFEARAKVDPDTAFMSIIEGTHTAALDGAGRPMEGFGSGDFVIDWDAAAKLPEHDDNVGRAAFTYSRLSPAAVTSVDVDFKGIQDKTTHEVFDAVYRYGATPGAGGDLRYAADQDITPGPGPTGTAKEHFTVHSRWQETGAGRCDIRATGGDLDAIPLVVTGSECWDSNFLSVYKNLSYDPNGDWGAEASCAFTPAEYAGL
jgi:hypothetical protein